MHHRVRSQTKESRVLIFAKLDAPLLLPSSSSSSSSSDLQQKAKFAIIGGAPCSTNPHESSDLRQVGWISGLNHTNASDRPVTRLRVNRKQFGGSGACLTWPQTLTLLHAKCNCGIRDVMIPLLMTPNPDPEFQIMLKIWLWIRILGRRNHNTSIISAWPWEGEGQS